MGRSYCNAFLFKFCNAASHAAGKFEERMKFVNKVIRPDMTPTAAAVGMVKCKGNKHIFKELAKVEKSGGEGLMLRQPGSLYKRCRDSSLLKVLFIFLCREIYSSAGKTAVH